MKKLLAFTILCLLMVSATTFAARLDVSKPIFATYWYGWGDSGSGDYAVGRLSDVTKVNGISSKKFTTIIQVAFGLEKNEACTELDIKMSDPTAFSKDVATLQSQGIKVVASIGGAAGLIPWRNRVTGDNLVSQIEVLVAKYKLDGVSIDMEDPEDTWAGSDIIYVLRQLRKKHADWIIGLDGEASPMEGIAPGRTNLTKAATALLGDNTIDYLEIQCYNYVDNYAAGQNSFSAATEKTATKSWYPGQTFYNNAYISCAYQTTTMLANAIYGSDSAANRGKIAKRLIVGLEMGVQDIYISRGKSTLDKNLPWSLYLDDMNTLMNGYLAPNNYLGFMTWSINRDQGGTTMPNSTCLETRKFAYTEAICANLTSGKWLNN